jgi:uncharacterized peroxidase-related enzyme
MTKENEMPLLQIHTLETAPEDSKPILAKLQSEVGFIPNLAATMAESPALLDAFTSQRTINQRRSSLSPVEREIISIAVAREYGCSYCVAAHSTFAAMAGAEESVIADARDGRAMDDSRLTALSEFARKVVQTPSRIDTSGLLQSGFAPQQVLDIFPIVAQVALASQAFLLAGTPLDAAFQPRAWKWNAGVLAG